MKRALVLIALFVFFFSFSFVAAENVTKVGEAYSCLQDKITERTCGLLSPEERFFSLMSVRYCEAEVLADAINDECWPASGCRAKSTAQAILSLDAAGQNTDAAETWLLDQKAIPEDVNWYIQVDSNDATDCTVTYGDAPYSFSVGVDKKITAGYLGGCVDVSGNGYWLEVENNLLCYEETFGVSCDQSFLTNLLFSKSGSSTIHVLEGTQTAPADGLTEENIDSFCFSTGSSCDYEGSLWAALVLDMAGKDISAFLPYLITMEEDNSEFLPEAFLYLLTSNTDYSTRLLAKQKPSNNGEYWSESGDRLYDTAVALLPYQISDNTEKTNTKEWLLSNEIQGDNGCWEENIRNTAFLLYSIWPNYAPIGDDGGDDDNGDDGEEGNETTLDCITEGYYCRSSIACYDDLGSILDSYQCAYPNVCCSLPPTPVDEFCEDLSGIVCAYDEICEDGITEETEGLSYGETCCIGGYCDDSTRDPPPEDDDCEDAGGICRSFGCSEDEEETTLYSCSGGGSCCVTSFGPGDGDKKPKWIIWLLVILVIIVVIAIIFRDKLRRMLFGMKSRTGKGGAKPGYGRGPRPPGPPKFPAPLTGHPERMPTPTGRMTPKPGGPKLRSQKELDDVLVKLKDMHGK